MRRRPRAGRDARVRVGLRRRGADRVLRARPARSAPTTGRRSRPRRGEVAARATWVAVAGSLPPGAPPDAAARLLRVARAAGARVALDVSGEALRLGLEAGPDFVKVNAEEAAELGFGTAEDLRTRRGATAAADVDAPGAVPAAAITRGADGMELATAEGGPSRGPSAARRVSGRQRRLGARRLPRRARRRRGWPAALERAAAARPRQRAGPGRGSAGLADSRSARPLSASNRCSSRWSTASSSRSPGVQVDAPAHARDEPRPRLVGQQPALVGRGPPRPRPPGASTRNETSASSPSASTTSASTSHPRQLRVGPRPGELERARPQAEHDVAAGARPGRAAAAARDPRTPPARPRTTR